MLYNIWKPYKKRGSCYVAIGLLYNKKLCHIVHPNLPDVGQVGAGHWKMITKLIKTLSQETKSLVMCGLFRDWSKLWGVVVGLATRRRSRPRHREDMEVNNNGTAIAPTWTLSLVDSGSEDPAGAPQASENSEAMITGMRAITSKWLVKHADSESAGMRRPGCSSHVPVQGRAGAPPVTVSDWPLAGSAAASADVESVAVRVTQWHCAVRAWAAMNF